MVLLAIGSVVAPDLVVLLTLESILVSVNDIKLFSSSIHSRLVIFHFKLESLFHLLLHELVRCNIVVQHLEVVETPKRLFVLTNSLYFVEPFFAHVSLHVTDLLLPFGSLDELHVDTLDLTFYFMLLFKFELVNLLTNGFGTFHHT